MKALRFEEFMSGTWSLPGTDTIAGAFQVSILAVGEDMKRISQEGRFQLQGRVHVAGLAHDSELVGALEVRPISKRELLYGFYFKADDGRRLFFQGRKKISWLRPLRSVTTLHGAFYHGDEELGETVARSKLSDIPSFLASFRVTAPEAKAEIPSEILDLRPDACASTIAHNEVPVSSLKRKGK